MHAEQAVWDDDAEHDHGEDDDLDAPGEIDVDGEYEDDMTLHTPVEDDVQWDEWVEDEDEAGSVIILELVLLAVDDGIKGCEKADQVCLGCGYCIDASSLMMLETRFG